MIKNTVTTQNIGTNKLYTTQTGKATLSFLSLLSGSQLLKEILYPDGEILLLNVHPFLG